MARVCSSGMADSRADCIFRRDKLQCRFFMSGFTALMIKRIAGGWEAVGGGDLGMRLSMVMRKTFVDAALLRGITPPQTKLEYNSPVR